MKVGYRQELQAFVWILPGAVIRRALLSLSLTHSLRAHLSAGEYSSCGTCRRLTYCTERKGECGSVGVWVIARVCVCVCVVLCVCVCYLPPTCAYGSAAAKPSTSSRAPCVCVCVCVCVFGRKSLHPLEYTLSLYVCSRAQEANASCGWRGVSARPVEPYAPPLLRLLHLVLGGGEVMVVQVDGSLDCAQPG